MSRGVAPGYDKPPRWGFVPPFQGFWDLGVLESQGVALGYDRSPFQGLGFRVFRIPRALP